MSDGIVDITDENIKEAPDVHIISVPYGDICIDFGQGIPDPNHPNMIWIQTMFTELNLQNPVYYDQQGLPIYHLDGDYDFGLYDLTTGKRISVSDGNSRFPSGVDVNRYGESRIYVPIQPEIFQQIFTKTLDRKNFAIKIFKDGVLIGNRSLGYYEGVPVFIDKVAVNQRVLKLVLNDMRDPGIPEFRDYIYNNAIYVEVVGSDGSVLQRSCYFQPYFNDNRKYRCPDLPLNQNIQGYITVRVNNGEKVRNTIWFSVADECSGILVK